MKIMPNRLDRGFYMYQEEFEKKAVDVLRSGWYVLGNEVKEFENEFADYCGAKHCVGLASGLDALWIAFRVLGIGKGDEVLVQGNTYIASVMGITINGATPVFIEPDEYYNIDASKLEEKITERTKAIMLVHYAGMVCNMDEFNKISREYNIPIIEDAAHALGSKYNGKIIGSNSRFTCFSFQAIKQMTTVDGGAITFTNEEDITPARKLRWFGLDKKVPRLENDITRAGYKYGMNNVTATIGKIQLEHTPAILERYISNGKYYDEALKGIKGVTLVPYYNNTEPSYWLYTMKVEDRDGFCKMMESNGITATQLHHRSDTHSVFAESKCELPNMEEWYSKFVHIPCGWWVDDETREMIVETIKKGW